ncbi:hypothetical protein B1F73_26475 [Pseudomonas syringae]|nr:hypothetical protein B1F73_26475 [Pseudomonas syringae]
MAGVMAGFVPTINPKNLGLDLASVQTVATKVITESVIKTAIMGGSFKDNLGSSIVSTGIATGGAIAAGKIGDFTLFDEGKLTKVGMHAVLGGLMSEAMGGDFRTGALAAGANEMVVDYLAERMLPSDLDKNSQAYQAGVSKLMTASQLIGALTAAATGGDASAAAAVTANSTQYNYLAHNQLKEAAEKLRKCAPAECDSIVAAYKKVSEDQTIEAIINCRFDVSLCKPSSRDVANTVADLSSVYDALGDGSKYAKDSLQILINENLEFQETLAVATTGASAQAVAETLQAKLKLTPEETVELAEAIGGGLAAAAGGVVAFRRVLAKASTRLERDGGSSVNKPVVDRTVDTLQDAGKQESSTAGMNAGAARRLDYEGAPYHGKVDNAVKSRAPVNGQDALDTSIQVKITSPRRVGIDYDSGEFVVFDKTLDTTYNGHVRSWGDLHADMQRALQQAGMVDWKGKILIGGDR